MSNGEKTPEKTKGAKAVAELGAKLGGKVKALQDRLDKQPMPAAFNNPALQNRAMAALIDFFVVTVFFFAMAILGGMIFSARVGAMAQGIAAVVSALYLLFKDGLEGRSLGKRLVGLKVIRTSGTSPVDFVTSAMRNWPIAAIFVGPMINTFLGFVPFSGILAMVVTGCAFGLQLYEIWRVVSDKEQGLRTGDVVAGTRVTED
ncbi:MAG: RDD family protein [Candidatus Wallbacteria bacterium]|nr:RDD family protein [Candidatus Wallbacteria bacterium]